MSILLYILAYLAFFACVAIIVWKIIGYLKKPTHLRWELYPVPHETEGRAEYGGSYLEKTDWYKEKQRGSVLGSIKGFLMEALFLHATYENNRELWYRSYPFHIGLYLLIGALGLTLFCVLLAMLGFVGGFFKFCFYAAYIFNILGFVGVLGGCIGLLQRRLTKPDLRKFSMPEHYFNLGLFAVFSALGLLMCIANGAAFTLMGVAFFSGMLTFTAIPIPALYALYLLISCFIFIWVPFSFMGHAFMKYFTWHDIRWGDQPTRDNPKTQAQLAENLKLRMTWKAPHIQSGDNPTWAEVATTPPPAKKDKE